MGVKALVRSEWSRYSVSFYHAATVGGRGNILGKVQDEKIGWELGGKEIEQILWMRSWGLHGGAQLTPNQET